MKIFSKMFNFILLTSTFSKWREGMRTIKYMLCQLLKLFGRYGGYIAQELLPLIYCKQFRDLMASAKPSYTMPRRNTLVPKNLNREIPC